MDKTMSNKECLLDENEREAMAGVYQELLLDHPQISPSAIATALCFMDVSAHFNLTQDAFFATFGLTSGRFSLLLLLKLGPITLTKLAKLAKVSKATMTQFIDGLEKDKFVLRVNDPKDKRTKLVTLTKKGIAILKKVMPQHLARLELFNKILNNDEVKHFLSYLQKIANGLDRTN